MAIYLYAAEYNAVKDGGEGVACFKEDTWLFLPISGRNWSESFSVRREEVILRGITCATVPRVFDTCWLTDGMRFPTGRGSLGFNGAEGRLISLICRWIEKSPDATPEEILGMLGYRPGINVSDLKIPD